MIEYLANAFRALLNLSFRRTIPALLLGAGAVHGQSSTVWNSTTGNWSNSPLWSAGMPTAGTNSAFIDNGGTVQVSGSAASQFVWLGSTAAKSGTLEVLSGGSATFTTVVVGGSGGTGNLRVAQGGVLSTYGGPIGSDVQSVGNAVVDGIGSLWRVGAELIVGNNGNGTLSLINGGVVTVDNGLGLVGLADNFVAEGTLRIGNGGAAGTLNATDVHGHDGKATVIFNHNEESYSFLPALVENLSVQHIGPGRTVLSTMHNYTGATDITGGHLLVQGSLQGLGAVNVSGTGILGGTGLIAGVTTINAGLSPGLATGLMTFGSDLTLLPQASVKMELGGYARGSQFDAINLSGTMTYGGGLTIAFVNGFEPKIGDSFRLFGGNILHAGTFADIAFPIAGYRGAFNPASGTLTISSIPEPRSLGLIAAGLGSVMGFGRRRSWTRLA